MFIALRRIQIFASDFPRSRRFYGETLGLSESGGFESDWVEFSLGPILLKLTPLRPGEVPARNQVAAVFSTPSLDSALGLLKERGVTVTRPPAEEFTGRSAEILDPDGYRIILFQASELHPDEEWIPASRVDELVRHKLAARRQRDKARGTSRPPARKPAKKKTAPKKPAKKARPAPKKTAKKAAPKKKAAKRPVAKKSRKR
ncbi:MAG TPA: VOC family protein [Thermoanaerobaculia bacterium]|nr:VOC family protein [Thermoanaerobaculia bacterium]HQR67333.1 VOC family protein [Thermoanaerobaculia bacterium]